MKVHLNHKKLSVYTPYILFLILVAIRVCQMAQKHEMHPDEVYSVMISQCNPHFYRSLPIGAYSGSEITSTLVAAHGVAADIKQLYIDNADAPHASLYYMLLRLAITGIDTWSPPELLLAGCILNLIFFSIAFIFLYKAGRLLFPAARWALCAMLALAFGCRASGESILLVREYEMATAAIIWFVYEIIRSLKLKQYDVITMLRLCMAVAIVMSTGYLNAYFLTLSSLIYLIFTYRQTTFRHTLRVCLVLLSGLLVAQAMYIGYFNFILHDNPHTRMAFGQLSTALSKTFLRDVCSQTFTWPGIWLILIITILPSCVKIFRESRKMYDSSLLAMLISAAALISIFLVQYTSILREARYSYPYIPLLALCLPVLISRYKEYHRVGLATAVTLFYLIVAVWESPTTAYGWSYLRYQLKDGAVLYNLNPNEIPLIAPVLTSGSVYKLDPKSDTINYIINKRTVVHYKPDVIDTSRFTGRHLIGPLYIITPKYK